MGLKNRILFFLGLLIPTLFVFRAFFVSGPVVWGDAPYFYPQHLRELVSESFFWTSWGNNFGGINQGFWLAPLMFIYGLLYNFFGLTSDVLIRIVFYFPAILLSIITPIIFARSLGYGRLIQFFASLFYVFNTYFLLLVDGGQVGIALAYGLFPLGLIYLKNFVAQPNLKKFFLAFIFLAILASLDPRVGLISVISVLVWVLSEAFMAAEKKYVGNLAWLVPLGIAVTAVNSYWIIPLLKLSEGVDINVSSVGLLSFLNGLFFFQPHWPANEFGKVVPPPFYFLGVPLLVFGSIFLKKDKKILSLVIVILFFTFLIKGTTHPFGEIYNWTIANLPFGTSFRDSTKFFIPLFLFGGLLIGTTLQYLTDKFHRFNWVVIGLVYFYLLFLIHPAFLGPPTGGLNGVLTQKVLPNDFKIIYKKFSGENETFRTAWFVERHPFGFHSEDRSAVDAKNLVNVRPFAALNVGNDTFNFVNREEFVDWFNLLGIKYLIFSGDPRKITWDENERKDWGNLLGLTAAASGLLKQDLGTSFPVYGLPDVKPKIFTTDKLMAVIGGDDIYQKIRENFKDFSVGNQAFVFFEDGKFEPKNLQGVASESVALVFNSKSEEDLTMSFLQKYFTSPSDAEFSQWAIRRTSEYLRWKYELLVKGVETQEFDYGKGLAFSTQKGERISFNLPIMEDGEYVLAVRSMSDNGQFEWKSEEGLILKKGKFKKEFENKDGISVINIVALIPKKELSIAQDLTRQFVGHFKVVKLDGTNDAQELKSDIFGSNWQKINYQKINNERYRIVPSGNSNWIVFTDSYHPLWKLKKGTEYLPSSAFYSMINGFFIGPNWTETEIVFKGQEQVRWGVYWSLVSILFLAVIFLFIYAKGNRPK